MTNEERQQAIEWLKRRPVMMAGAKRMYDLAVEALEAYVPDKNVGDMISRQAAIDTLNEQIEQCNKALGSFDISLKDEFAIKVERASLEAYKEQLENLPPAEHRLIRCKDCDWWTKQEASLQGRCALSGTYPTGAWFCANARKRGEEDGNN